MGCCQSNNDVQYKGANKGIQREMRLQEMQDKKENKLLLLGPGSSGKSTLFKGMRLVTGETFHDREQTDTRHVIRANLVAGMLTLLQKSQNLYDKDNVEFGPCLVDMTDTNIVSWIQTVVNFADEQFNDDDTMDPQQLKELGTAIGELWMLDQIQFTFSKRGGRFSFPDNLDHYFNKADRIMAMDYMPDDEDFLKARIRTTGVIEMAYEKDDNIFKIFDVGGQRSERKKWIHSFDNVAAVLFVSALNHYNAVLFEDETRNSLHEAIELFQEICNSKWFRKSEMILFLNKDDLFRLNIGAGHSLSICFSKEKAWDGDQWTGPDYEPKENVMFEDDEEFQVCYEAALEFIQNQFIKQKEDPKKVIFNHVTCATDTNAVQQVFWDVQNIVIRANLKRGGLMV